MKEINAKLLEEIRLHYSTCTYQIDDNDYLIVPVDETHDFLLNNFQINNLILKFYYAQSNALFSDADYKKMTETGYVGRKEQTLKPYPIVIYGAYFNRAELYTKILSLSWQPKNKRPTLNNKQIEYFEDLFPYFKEYSEGFKNGYEGFEEKYINKYLPLFPDKKDFTDKVFEHLTKKIIFQHDWLNAHSGFTIQTTESGKKVSNTGKIVNAYEDGQIQGYFYKAWKIVFSNNNLFAPLFESYYQNLKSKSHKNKPEKSLHHFFNKIKDIDGFINELKTTFPIEKGQRIRVIIDSLKDEEILLIGEREFADFYRKLKENFKRDIGTYPSINDVKDIPDLTTQEINDKLNPLIIKYKEK
jgi:hypothetical protein